MNGNEKNKISYSIAKYSVYFLIFSFFCVIFFFLLDNKSMIDINDGLQLRYTRFVYIGRTVRDMFGNLFLNHTFELPMWDSTIGMGSDCQIINSLIATPFQCLLSALVPVEFSEYAFNFYALLQLYIAGITFLLFANEKGYKNTNAIAGSLVYVFSATVFVIFQQVTFSSTYILFPLLLLGTNRIWNKKSSYIYIAILTYSAFLTYYYTYMMIILLFVYCLIRFFCEDERSLKKFFSLLGHFIVPTLLSVITAFALNLSTLKSVSKLSRIKTHYAIDIFDFEVIKRLISYGFSYVQADGDSLIGASSFAFVAIVCLFVSRKKESTIKWCLSLCLISFAFPIIGSALNGFNYASYRYIFSLIICIAYLVTAAFDSVLLLKGKIWVICLVISMLYGIFCYLFIDYYAVISAVSLLITVTLVGIINRFNQKLSKIYKELYVGVILVSCIIIGYSCCHMSLSPSMLEQGSVYNMVFTNSSIPLRKAVDDPNYRTDSISADFSTTVMNSSMAAGVNGFDSYSSVQSQLMEDYYTTLDVLGNPMEFSLTGFRGRCYLEILNACNYITYSEETDTCIRAPYSYDYEKTNGDYSLYKSGRGVSLVYYYDDVISTETFLKMNPPMRETNLMYSMVVDSPEKSENDLISDFISVPFEIEAGDNVSIDGKTITVNDGIGKITLIPDEIASGQISIYLSGFSSSNQNDWYYRNAVALLDSDNNPIVMDYSAQFPTTYKYYYGNDDLVFSFESIDEKVEKICLLFFNSGEYNLDSIQVLSRPYENMDNTLNAFYDHADLDNITYDYSGNHLNITTTTDHDRFLYIAIPYSEGWTAEVDGNEVSIINANIAFMAIPISAGTHNIEMTYCTPNLNLSLTISAIGILLTAGYLILEKKIITK